MAPRGNGGNYWWFRHRKRLVSGGAAPDAIGDLAATANSDGTITLEWTLPEGATSVLIRYNVDQDAAPADTDEGILLTTDSGESYVWDSASVEYGHSYKFSIWPHNAAGYADPDTATAVGPFNPQSFSAYPFLWYEADQESYSLGAGVETPLQLISGGPAVTQPTSGNRPQWVDDPHNGLSASCFNFTASVPRYWVGTDTPAHDNSRGLTVAAYIKMTSTGTRTIAAKWETAGDGLEWRFGAYGYGLTTGYALEVCEIGSAAGQHLCLSEHNTTMHVATFAWKPSTRIIGIIDDGTLTTVTSTIPATIPDTDSVLTIGGTEGGTSENWDGPIGTLLIFSDYIGDLAMSLLNAAMSDRGGI